MSGPYRFRRTTLLVVGGVSVIGGVALATQPGWPALAGSFGVYGAAMSLLSLGRRSVVALLAVCLLGGALGLWRGGIFVEKRADYAALYDQKVTLQVTAFNDATYGKTKQLTFDAGNIVLANGQTLAGKIQVSGFGLNAVFQNDQLLVTGKLRATKGAAQARLSFAKLQLVKHQPTPIGELRRRFTVGIQNALPEPLNGFAMGLLVGQRATLPEDIKETLLTVGLTHIIAVSGYNLTIMLRASRRLLAEQSKRLSLLLSLGLIITFLLITGSSASIVRAALVSTLSIWAGYYGRQFRPLLLILAVAALTAWVNPFYIWSDAGWYLSFLAFGGVMLLAPLVEDRLPPRWSNSVIAMVAVESICAETFTLPYLLHTFGQTSLVGLTANVLVVALIPLAMLLGLLAGLAGILVAPLAGWLAWPAVLLLTYMLDIANLLSGVPHSFQENIELSLAAMLVLYLAIALLCIALNFKNKPKTAIITDKQRHKQLQFERMHIV